MSGVVSILQRKWIVRIIFLLASHQFPFHRILQLVTLGCGGSRPHALIVELCAEVVRLPVQRTGGKRGSGRVIPLGIWPRSSPHLMRWWNHPGTSGRCGDGMGDALARMYRC